MEVTKWLKPSISVSRSGDSASVQAATRVNAEQASKRNPCEMARNSGGTEALWLWTSSSYASDFPRRDHHLVVNEVRAAGMTQQEIRAVHVLGVDRRHGE